MKYTKEQRLAIGQRIYDGEISRYEAAGERPIEAEVDDYICFFNEQRPAYSLGYLPPKQYRERHGSGG